MAVQHSFHIAIQKFADKVEGRLDHTFKKICLDLDRGVVLSTPVKTGRARGGWNVGINSVNLEENEIVVPGDDERAGVGGPTANATLRRNEDEIMKAKAGDVVFISNNVNYIEYLEGGSSDQAPEGMVAKTIRRFPQIVQGAVTESKRKIP